MQVDTYDTYDTNRFDLVLAFPCDIVWENKYRLKRYFEKEGWLNNFSGRIENIISGLDAEEDIKTKYRDKLRKKYSGILNKKLVAKREEDDLLILALGLSSLEKIGDNPIQCREKRGGMEIRNNEYDGKNKLLHYAEIFCDQLAAHSQYELVFCDESGNIKTERTPFLFGQVIIYEDEIESTYTPNSCYNFFCVLSELTVDKDDFFENDAFNIIYFVVPDVSYLDLTLLLDKSHDLWCNIYNQCEELSEDGLVLNKYKSDLDNPDRVFPIIFTEFLESIGYKYLEKIYRVIFSNFEQFTNIYKSIGP
ncbi:MAG: hypothetical protein LBU84_09605 [Prevotella sp.]|jgi:hypothetical protein|nr:hypothetical protein [Prevotella sp.]